MNGGDEWQIGVISVSVYLSTYFIKANLSKKPAKKKLKCHGGKINFEFFLIKFKFNFPAK